MWLPFIHLLLLPSLLMAGEQAALTPLRQQLSQIKTQEELLQQWGKPKKVCDEALFLKQNLRRALALKDKQGKNILLEAHGVDLKETQEQIDSLSTYDYYGIGKWASFIGIYFDAHHHILGWDWRVPQEATFSFTPHLFVEPTPPKSLKEKLSTLLATPFTWTRGLKQTGCELAKAPLNFLEVSWFLGPKAGWQAAGQKIKTTSALFHYFFLNRSTQNPVAAFQNLVCEIPVIGSFFDHPSPKKMPSQFNALFLLGGIHQINATAQRMDALELFLKEKLRTDAVYQIPWVYGTMMDVGCNTLNLSHGDSLILAQQIVQRGKLKPGDRIALFAHSGAIQQVIGIARILRDEKIYVTCAFGVAGVFVGGKAPIEHFKIIFNPDQDRFKSLLGFQSLTPGIHWKKVRGKDPAKAHELSGSLDKQTRLLYDGYFDEIGNFFSSNN